MVTQNTQYSFPTLNNLREKSLRMYQRWDVKTLTVESTAQSSSEHDTDIENMEMQISNVKQKL